ncbi:MAG: hypothetical protein HUU46_03960 [Candidatus Hydrogenedentes bacterium]|nr:hypothetical protein [Candidatus Hydrogenedentota bacterium]
MRIRIVLLCCLVSAGCATNDNARSAEVVRLRFVPGSPPTNGLESSRGAVWTSFSEWPGSRGETIMLMGSAAIGDKFPVAHRNGPGLFEILLKDGDDSHVVLDIISRMETTSIDLRRDDSAKVLVAGTEYTISYPSQEVAASEGKSTTNKATIFVATPKPKQSPA